MIDPWISDVSRGEVKNRRLQVMQIHTPIAFVGGRPLDSAVKAFADDGVVVAGWTVSGSLVGHQAKNATRCCRQIRRRFQLREDGGRCGQDVVQIQIQRQIVDVLKKKIA